MATFRVGQRVRILRSEIPSRIGLEATILSDLNLVVDCISGETMQAHDIDIDGIGPAGPNGFPIAYPPAHLTHSQPARNKTVEWSKCLWQPEHMRQQA